MAMYMYLEIPMVRPVQSLDTLMEEKNAKQSEIFELHSPSLKVALI